MFEPINFHVNKYVSLTEDELDMLNEVLEFAAVPKKSILLHEGDVLGYQLHKQEGNRFRFVTDAIENASIVDIIENPNESGGINAAGTNHHIAFRVQNEEVLIQYREKIVEKAWASHQKLTGIISSPCISVSRVVCCLNWQQTILVLQKMNCRKRWEML